MFEFALLVLLLALGLLAPYAFYSRNRVYQAYRREVAENLRLTKELDALQDQLWVLQADQAALARHRAALVKLRN